MTVEVLKQFSSNLAPARYIAKKKNDIYNVVAMATLLAPVFSVKNQIFPFVTF